MLGRGECGVRWLMVVLAVGVVGLGLWVAPGARASGDAIEGFGR